LCSVPGIIEESTKFSQMAKSVQATGNFAGWTLEGYRCSVKLAGPPAYDEQGVLNG